MALTELADRFQVPSLLKICEQHLMNCVEIPLIMRLLLADEHAGLKDLKVSFISYNNVDLFTVVVKTGDLKNFDTFPFISSI